MRRTTETSLTIRGVEVPVKVVLEKRRYYRYALTRRCALLRLPSSASDKDVGQHLHRLGQWVEELAGQKPEVLAHFRGHNYRDGDGLLVNERRYVLQIHDEQRSTHVGYLEGKTIVLRLCSHVTASERTKAIRVLLSRVVAGDFQAEIERRVHEINRRTVNRPIRRISLKYNTSNWGSCSSRGNINLSTRLLFAPQEVQDYVILHELAHLVEHNHSDRFWALVKQYMPDYRRHEKWLRENSHLCRF